jgi:hypothetical protein
VALSRLSKKTTCSPPGSRHDEITDIIVELETRMNKGTKEKASDIPENGEALLIQG